MMGVELTSNFWMTGASRSLGRVRRIAETLSRTSCTAWSPSRSSSNWISTTPALSMLVERIVLTAAMELTASSIFSTTFVSTDSGSAPG